MTTTIVTYTNPKNGDTIQTDLTEDRAAEICSGIPGFAQDLAAKWSRKMYMGNRFSDAQLFWLMKLAHERLHPAEKPHIKLHEGAEARICDMFASVGLKVPKLRFKTPVGTVRISRSLRGILYVFVGQAIGGNIVDDKFFYRGEEPSEEFQILIKAVAMAPKEMAILWGQKTGCCCFCFRELTTPESVTAGYGPVCAEKWGLPWGMTGGEAVEG